MNQYETDTVVLGLGAMGSAALYHLALRGISAIGVEQFALGHDRGSTHGPSRVFRAFYADPIYVEMARAAQGQWLELERRSGTDLLTLCGQLIISDSENLDFQKRLLVLEDTKEQYEILTKPQTLKRFPMLQLPAGKVGCWIPRGGFLRPDLALKAMISEALKSGSKVLDSQRVVGLDRQSNRIAVVTEESRILCQRLICAGGAWTSSLLPAMDLNLQVTRQQKFHFKSANVADLKPGKFPVYTDADLNYYGFPVLDGILNVADDNLGNLVQPDDVKRDADIKVRDQLAQWVESLFPGRNWQHVETETCLYTNTPDDHFVLDRIPELPGAVIAAGFSGHGFKFTPLIGQLLVQISLEEAPTTAIDIFRLLATRKLQ